MLFEKHVTDFKSKISHTSIRYNPGNGLSTHHFLGTVFKRYILEYRVSSTNQIKIITKNTAQRH